MLGIQSYKIQKGVLPLVTTIVGGLIILFSMGIAFVFFCSFNVFKQNSSSQRF